MPRSALIAIALLLAACSRPPPDSTPDGALRLWIEKMESQVNDPQKGKDAFALLGPQARANLEERSQRASRAQGRRVEAWEMLAQGRFGLKFRPETMRATTTGDTSTIEVEGDDPTVDHATVRCVREGLAWRVEPELTPPPEQQKRPGSDKP